MKLLCLPCAGGSESMYFKLKRKLKDIIEVVPVKLSGRGYRIIDPLYNSIEEAVGDIFENIKDTILDGNYAIFGHSMGSLLTYELYYKIVENNFPTPKYLFLSSVEEPEFIPRRNKIAQFDDYEFVQHVYEMGGTPKIVLENKKILDVFLPIMRSDFKMFEAYQYKKRKEKINCDIAVFYGKQDTIEVANLERWENYTNKNFTIKGFEGNHFYLDSNLDNLHDIIKNLLVNI
ncbi:thioesterase [Sedimentibacter sp. zth1]|uniref:thioesterase II family protein n=1 Tax=Sedimentibacter sp. zth1 TaxID=2816908 RepID=UPI001A92D815|nr:thioesterase [Sedimentibacter sp. zth1]QSX06497.1 thioesterase [Sedimentibacter sp. zth1]